tara:strand:+ start:3777 stop:7517 length:3741 start_codon:yes stop_codon:yes gene_type:complete
MEFSEHLGKHLGKLLLEDKNDRLLAIINIYSPYEDVDVKSAYRIADPKSDRPMLLDAQKSSKTERQMDSIFGGERKNQPIRAHVDQLGVKIPRAIMAKWSSELVDIRSEVEREEKKNATETNKANFEKFSVVAKARWNNAAITDAELESIVQLSSSNMQKIHAICTGEQRNANDPEYGKYRKEWHPFVADNYDPAYVAARAIFQEVSRVEGIGDPSEIGEAVNDWDEAQWKKLNAYVVNVLRKEHIDQTVNETVNLVAEIFANLDEYYDNEVGEGEEYVVGGKLQDISLLFDKNSVVMVAVRALMPVAARDGLDYSVSPKEFIEWFENASKQKESVVYFQSLFLKLGIVASQSNNDYLNVHREIVDKLSKAQIDMDRKRSLSRRKAQVRSLEVDSGTQGVEPRNILDLPREKGDVRPTPKDLAEQAKAEYQKHLRGDKNAQKPNWFWVVISGMEDANMTGVSPDLSKSAKGRALGVCPHCHGDPDQQGVGYDGVEKCAECDNGYVDAWYWANESGYSAHPGHDSNKKQQNLTPFDKIFRAVWEALNDLEDLMMISPENVEAYDGFEREEPKFVTDGGEISYDKIGTLKTEKGETRGSSGAAKEIKYPVPAKVDHLTKGPLAKGSANVASSTAVIKIETRTPRLDWPGEKYRSGMLSKVAEWPTIDPYNLDLDVDKVYDAIGADPAYKNDSTFGVYEVIMRKIKEKIIRSGMRIDPNAWALEENEPDPDDQGRFGKTGSKDLHAKIWDYVVEPGYLQNLTSGDDEKEVQELEGELLSPSQPPFSAVREGAAVFRIVQHLERINMPEPFLAMAIGEYDRIPKDTLQSLPKWVKDVSFVAKIAEGLKNIKKQEGDFEQKGQIINELERVLKVFKDNGYTDHESMPKYITNYIKIMDGLETMRNSHIFSMPKDWGDHINDKKRLSTKLYKRESLLNRANSIEEIWRDLDSPDATPHFALKLSMGYRWMVPDFITAKYQNRLEAEKSKEEKLQKEVADVKLKTLIGDDTYAGEWLPIRYLEITVEELKALIKIAKSTGNQKMVALLEEFLTEVVVILDKSMFKLRDPAYKKRINREKQRLNRYKKYDKPEELIAQRSFDIKNHVALAIWKMKTGEISEEEVQQDEKCLESLIFLEIQKMVKTTLEHEGGASKSRWSKSNVYKSLREIAPSVFDWSAKFNNYGPDDTLDGLVYPGTGMDTDNLNKVLQGLKALNTNPKYEDEALEIVNKAFKDKKEASPADAGCDIRSPLES